MNKLAYLLITLALFVGVGIGFAISNVAAVSLLAWAIVRISVVGIFFVLFDMIVLRRLDTVEQLEKNNVAYGLFLLAFAVLVHGAISAV